MRIFVDLNQKNWEKLLPGAKFAINANFLKITQYIPFLIFKKYELRMSFNINAVEKDYNIVKKHIKHGRVHLIANDIKKYKTGTEHK